MYLCSTNYYWISILSNEEETLLVIVFKIEELKNRAVPVDMVANYNLAKEGLKNNV